MRPRSLVSLGFGLVLLLDATPTRAAARVFVSVNGTDAGNCSDVNAPCRTLDFAINAVDAGGVVIVLTTGSYSGATISKSAKVTAPSGVVAFSASPITILAGASDLVVINGLTIKALIPGSGYGVYFISGAELQVVDCVIDGWETGIYSSASAASLSINGTTVRNSTSHQVIVSGTGSTVSVDRSRFENGGGGGCGIVARDGSKVSIARSVSSGNGYGFCTQVLSGGQAELNVESSLIANNGSGGVACFAAGETIRAANNTVTDNFVGLFQNSTCLLESLGNNTVRGNAFNTFGTITLVSGN